MKWLYLLLTLFFLTACVSTGRYSQRHDSAPDYDYGHITTEEVVPEYVEYNPANTRPYAMFGQYFTPLETGLGYEAVGEASWYGQKFHGHLTANGEVYDMHQFTAAHKTLPLPSFVKVTNLRNNKELVVKVNDRGPFHNGRIIDLSYAAAKELDVLSTGTTQVKIEVIHVAKNGAMHIGKTPYPLPSQDEYPETDADTQQVFIQVAALQDQKKIGELARGLAVLYQVPTHTPVNDGVYRLRLGPFNNEQESDVLLRQLKLSGFDSAYKVYAPN
ncbi:MAG: septal ring lytic transglycosylase RlpA family protein [Aestuariibacter sp.]